MYTFSLVPSDLNELYLMPYINPVRQGNVLLEVYSETLNCQAYAEFPAILEVDQSLDIKYTKL